MKVTIIGAGPAGIFTAFELGKSGDMDILLIEQGPDIDNRHCPMMRLGRCTYCKICHVTHGFGGAGVFSDGKLDITPYVGGNLEEFVSQDEAWKIVRYVDEVFVKHGGDTKLIVPDPEKVAELKKKAAAAGIDFLEFPVRHLGTENSVRVITNLKRTLKRMGVKIMFNTKVKGIKTDGETAKGVVLENNKEIDSDYVVVAPGRSGAKWFSQEIKRLGVEAEHNPVDLGLRVEVPKVVLEPVTEIVWDPKFHIMTKTYDDFVRTFCVNHGGYVINEVYEDFVSVNGHTMKDNKSENSNFALLVRVKLTEPVQDAAEYGRAIARSVTNIGGGKPIIQRLGDLLNGRRSTWSRIRRSYVRPTLRDVTPGDIAMAMPYRFVTDIVESIERLDYVIPGVAADSTLLYAIEIKEYSMRVKVNQGMETNIKNLYAVGDGAGISRNIVIAASTGILAARSILEKEGYVWEPSLPKRN